jgi:hypothetical protein
MATRQRKNPDEKIKYLLKRNGRGPQEEFVIEIPANWKVTFSSVNPNSQAMRGDGYAVRIYEGEKLRAVYCDIKELRDLSIPMAVKVEAKIAESKFESDSLGNFDLTQSQKVLDASFEVVDDDGPNF